MVYVPLVQTLDSGAGVGHGRPPTTWWYPSGEVRQYHVDRYRVSHRTAGW